MSSTTAHLDRDLSPVEVIAFMIADAELRVPVYIDPPGW